MKKIQFLLLLMLTLSINIFGQVGINTDKPSAYAGLHVSERKDSISTNPDKYNGIIIQRYTETERDAQLTPNLKKTENSLMIYNTTEDCYNYWNNAEKEWKSLCGALGKAVFTIDCASVQVKGYYREGTELTASNYLSMSVNVTKPGEYTVMATTDNGYSFFTSGTFLSAGSQTIQVLGQGTPVTSKIDALTISANGVDVNCNPAIEVNVLSAAATYTMNCGSATVNGVYKVGSALDGTNTITLPVVVTNTGSYSITTNTVNGISFSGSGTFSSTGNQNVTLYGTGTPSSTSTTTLTITSDSQGGVSTTCSVSVTIVIPKKRLLAIGTDPNGYGYNLSGTAASNKLITTATNYGTLPNSVVPYEGWDEIINGSNSPSVLQLTNWTTGSNPVDIIVIGYSWGANAAEAQVIANYLAKGGVVLAFVESGSGAQNILRAVFDASVTTSGVNSGGAVYKLPLTNDSILNGPFGDIRGLQWGEDASSTEYAIGLPSSEITVYSGDTNISTSSPSGNVGRVTAFRHNTLNFLWVGDGGFNSNHSGNSDTICPFKLDANNFPTFKPNYGNGSSAYEYSVYNAVFTANAFAWALDKAEHSGINTH